jgi:tocopherol cyclase
MSLPAGPGLGYIQMMPRKPWNEFYKGEGRTRRYFEGFYFKQVSADRSEAWSFIPGISRGDRKGEGYSFAQVIEGKSGRTWWFQYPLEEFVASADRLELRVGKSRFGDSGIVLDLEGEEGRFRGELRFGAFRGLPSKPLWPGVMGPFSFLPLMECRHGLISLDHRVTGDFVAGGRRISMGGAGRGYIEKDWGSSMPSSWIWMQSNNFAAEGDSFMLSIARIPWLGSAFTGFICVGSLAGRLLREATYTGARLRDFRLEDGGLSLAIVRGSSRLEIVASRSRGGLLRAPVNGLLTRRISESVDAGIGLRWTEKGKVVFEGEATGAGLELVGDVPSLLGNAAATGAGGRRLAGRRPAYAPAGAGGDAESSRLE